MMILYTHFISFRVRLGKYVCKETYGAWVRRGSCTSIQVGDGEGGRAGGECNRGLFDESMDFLVGKVTLT